MEKDLSWFWSNVSIKGPNECWEWEGTCTPGGYGLVYPWGPRGKSEMAHRFIWSVFNGPIPKFIERRKTLIRHLCDNRACVNPKHLAIGNYSDNANDARRKGIGIKTSKEDFRKVKELRASGMTCPRISKKLNLSRTIVWRITNEIGIYSEWAKELNIK